MTNPSNGAPLSLPARDIPVPTSVSEQAQSIIAMGPLSPPLEFPAVDDHDGWRALVAKQDATMVARMVAIVSTLAADVETIDANGVPVYVATPHGTTADDKRIYFDIHGGAFVQGAGEVCRAASLSNAARIQARVWAVDYRMPPGHPYPTPVDDCLTAYRALLEDHRPQDIVVGGASAGGNLAAAMLLRARDEGVPLPAAAVLLTPEADLTESGDSFNTNLGLDPFLLQRLMPVNLLYANGHDLTDPYLSPLFADFTKGFPPTFLSTGTRDLFLSNTVLLHRALRAADIPAELHVIEAGGHGLYMGTAPEDAALFHELRTFAGRLWAGISAPAAG